MAISKFENRVYNCLVELFEGYKIERQYYVSFHNRRLIYDFYIPALNIVIECQGEQHYKFTQFYHKTKVSFAEAIIRDRLKREYAKENHLMLIEFSYSKFKDCSCVEIMERIYVKYTGKELG